MPSWTRLSSLAPLLAIFIIILLLFSFAPDIHQRASIRHQKRRSDLAPRQVENTTQAAGSSTTTSVSTVETIPIPSSSTSSTLHSSSTSIGPSSPSTFTRSTTSSRLSSSATSSTQTVPTSESASSGSSSSSSSSSSHPLIISSTSSTVSTSSSVPRLSSSSSSLASISIPSTVTSSITSDPTPQTTLVIAPASSTSILPPTLTHSNPSPASATSSPSTHDFWANKGAVAGTFTAVGLIIIGIVVALAFFLRRRLQIRDIESYESFTAQSPMGQLTSGNVTPLDVGRLPASPGLSVNDLAAQDPLNPHASNQAYSEYIPYVPQGLAPVQERGSDPSMSFSNTTSKRPTVKRRSYQPSIDSFYGAPGA